MRRAISGSKSSTITARRFSGPAEAIAVELPLEPAVAHDRPLDGLAAPAGEGVAVGFEALDALGRREALAGRLRLELGHDPFQLVERAAGPLAILLREFRPLRADQAGDQGDRERPVSASAWGCPVP